MERVECDVAVIGAGVVGLAVGASLDPSLSVVCLESFGKFGQETSSRNSEVIHSGIYYPPGSRKTEWCLYGRELLYAFCKMHGVPYRNTAKLVVATCEAEMAYLQKLSGHCKEIGVPHSWLTSAEISEKEPLVKAQSALYFPRSGIVDSHSMMAVLERHFAQRGGMLAYRHRVKDVERFNDQWLLLVERPDGMMGIMAKKVVNCAGLGACELSNKAMNTQRFEHRFCRGRYFSLSPKYQEAFKHLVYPCPPKDGLGVHITVDTSGFARLGPDVDWCENVPYEKIDTLYDCNWEELKPTFLAAARRYCPSIADNEASPGLIGVRPKLFIDGKASPDFYVESQNDWTHCLGIESPGLTSSLAIAEHVKELVEKA